MSDDFFQRVYAVVKKIPKGKVTTYGLIAESLSSKQAARMVGWALNKSSGHQVPAHRVVNRLGELTGRIHFGDSNLMKDLLLSEGVQFQGDRVNLEKHLWHPPVRNPVHVSIQFCKQNHRACIE